MGTYSDKGPPPPGVAVAARRMAEDPNDEPQYGDRVPYVIVRGPPGTRLVDRAVPPEEALNDPCVFRYRPSYADAYIELVYDSHKHLDAHYYISRVLIPPLERIFNLVGADVRGWYDEMPKALRADEPDAVLMSPRKASKQAALINRYKIDEHFFSSHCLACGAFCAEGMSDKYQCSPNLSIDILALGILCWQCCVIPAGGGQLRQSRDFQQKSTVQRPGSPTCISSVPHALVSLQPIPSGASRLTALGYMNARRWRTRPNCYR